MQKSYTLKDLAKKYKKTNRRKNFRSWYEATKGSKQSKGATEITNAGNVLYNNAFFNQAMGSVDPSVNISGIGNIAGVGAPDGGVGMVSSAPVGGAMGEKLDIDIKSNTSRISSKSCKDKWNGYKERMEKDIKKDLKEGKYINSKDMDRILNIVMDIDPDIDDDIDSDDIYHEDAYLIKLDGDGRVWDEDLWNPSYKDIFEKVKKAIEDEADRVWGKKDLREDIELEELDAVKLQYLSDDEILEDLENASIGSKIRNIGLREGSLEYKLWGNQECRVEKQNGYEINHYFSPAWAQGMSVKDLNDSRGKTTWWTVNGDKTHIYDLLKIIKDKNKYYQVKDFNGLKESKITAATVNEVEKMNNKYSLKECINFYKSKKLNETLYSSIEEIPEEYKKAWERCKENHFLRASDITEISTAHEGSTPFIYIEFNNGEAANLFNNGSYWHSEMDEEEEESFENTVGATSVRDAKEWLDSQLEEYGNTYYFPSDVKAELNRLIADFGNTYFWNRFTESLNEDYPYSVVDELVDKYSIYYHPVERENIKSEIINLTGNADVVNDVVDESDINYDKRVNQISEIIKWFKSKGVEILNTGNGRKGSLAIRFKASDSKNLAKALDSLGIQWKYIEFIPEKDSRVVIIGSEIFYNPLNESIEYNFLDGQIEKMADMLKADGYYPGIDWKEKTITVPYKGKRAKHERDNLGFIKHAKNRANVYAPIEYTEKDNTCILTFGDYGNDLKESLDTTIWVHSIEEDKWYPWSSVDGEDFDLEVFKDALISRHGNKYDDVKVEHNKGKETLDEELNASDYNNHLNTGLNPNREPYKSYGMKTIGDAIDIIRDWGRKAGLHYAYSIFTYDDEESGRSGRSGGLVDSASDIDEAIDMAEKFIEKNNRPVYVEFIVSDRDYEIMDSKVVWESKDGLKEDLNEAKKPTRRESDEKMKELLKQFSDELKESNGDPTDTEVELDSKFDTYNFWNELREEARKNNIRLTIKEKHKEDDWVYYYLILKKYVEDELLNKAVSNYTITYFKNTQARYRGTASEDELKDEVVTETIESENDLEALRTAIIIQLDIDVDDENDQIYAYEMLEDMNTIAKCKNYLDDVDASGGERVIISVKKSGKIIYESGFDISDYLKESLNERALIDDIYTEEDLKALKFPLGTHVKGRLYGSNKEVTGTIIGPAVVGDANIKLDKPTDGIAVITNIERLDESLNEAIYFDGPDGAELADFMSKAYKDINDKYWPFKIYYNSVGEYWTVITGPKGEEFVIQGSGYKGKTYSEPKSLYYYEPSKYSGTAPRGEKIADFTSNQNEEDIIKYLIDKGYVELESPGAIYKWGFKPEWKNYFWTKYLIPAIENRFEYHNDVAWLDAAVDFAISDYIEKEKEEFPKDFTDKEIIKLINERGDDFYFYQDTAKGGLNAWAAKDADDLDNYFDNNQDGYVSDDEDAVWRKEDKNKFKKVNQLKESLSIHSKYDINKVNENIHQKDGISIYNNIIYRWKDNTHSDFEYHSFISGLSDHLRNIMWDRLNDFKIQLNNQNGYVELEVVPQNEEILLGENTYPFDDVFTGKVLDYIEDVDKIYYELTQRALKKELEDIEKNILPKIAKDWGFRKQR